MKKIVNLENGILSQDAHEFSKMLEKDAQERVGYSQIETINGKLSSCYYMSLRMKKIAEIFSDVIIVDTTHKTNRFNMPLLDIVVINNLGHTVTIFLSLLGDQKQGSFLWALSKFKNHLKKEPGVIFSDDDEALVNGNSS